jgi:hypothetical protein
MPDVVAIDGDDDQAETDLRHRARHERRHEPVDEIGEKAAPA